jgi:hypothetical protein
VSFHSSTTLTQFLNTDHGQLDLVLEHKKLQNYRAASSDVLPQLRKIQISVARDTTACTDPEPQRNVSLHTSGADFVQLIHSTKLLVSPLIARIPLIEVDVTITVFCSVRLVATASVHTDPLYLKI